MNAARGEGEQTSRGRASTRHGQATRDAIIEAAYEILQYEGAAAVSTRHIAAQAGVNQALVHYHFGSVDQVMVSVLERVAADVAARQQDHYASDKSFPEKYRSDMKELLDQDQRDGWGKVWIEAVAYALNAPGALEALVGEQRSPAGRAIETAVLDASGRKDREAKRDAEALAALVAIFRSGLAVHRLTNPSPVHRRAVELLGEFVAERAGDGTPAPAPTAKAAKPGKAGRGSR